MTDEIKDLQKKKFLASTIEGLPRDADQYTKEAAKKKDFNFSF